MPSVGFEYRSAATIQAVLVLFQIGAKGSEHLRAEGLVKGADFLEHIQTAVWVLSQGSSASYVRRRGVIMNTLLTATSLDWTNSNHIDIWQARESDETNTLLGRLA